jgi:flavin reductase (DIM6/NTAB) family NADH-FMN oxidoreductase RutF
MTIDVGSADVLAVYRALIGAVTPRPIAWVTTLDGQGRVNLAPFSFFNAFGANPPIVVFSPTLRRDGSKKDTLLNLESIPEFVLNAAVEDLALKINASSTELPRGQSEVDYTGLTLQPSSKVRPPRIAESPVHLECLVRQVMSIGEGPIAANLVIGEVLFIHIEDNLLDSHGQIDPRKLHTIARLGGSYYCRSTNLFEMERP